MSSLRRINPSTRAHGPARAVAGGELRVGAGRLALRGFALLLAAMAQSCGSEQAAPADVEIDVTPSADSVIAPQEYIEFGPCSEAATTQNLCPTVNLEVIACSAAVGCRDGFLRDPDTNEPVFTATTSFTCGFESSDEPGVDAVVFDALPSFTSQVRCVGSEGEAVTPPEPEFGHHRFYGQTPRPDGSFFLNTARALPALFETDTQSCLIESWANIHFDRVLDDPPEPRAPRVDRWAPVVQWQTEITDLGDGYACAPSSVSRQVAFAVVHDLPSSPQKLTFPTERASVVLLEREHDDPIDGRPFRALDGIATGLVPARFGPNEPPATFSRRTFTVPYPEVEGVEPSLVGRPASIRPTWVCLALTPEQQVAHVGVVFVFEGYEELLPPGILIIDRERGGLDWECEREGPPEAPACHLYGDAFDASWVDAVPCLGPHIPGSGSCGELVAGQVAPEAQQVCAGHPVEALSVTEPEGFSGPWHYTWESSVDGAGWTPVAGSSGQSFSPPIVTGTRWYRSRAESPCGVVLTEAVSVEVAAPVSGGLVGSDQVLCPEESPAPFVNIASGSGGLGGGSYQWQQSMEPFGWVGLGGQTGETFTPSGLGSYRRRYTGGSCGSALSNTVTVSGAPAPDPGAIEGDEELCANSTPSLIENAMDASGDPPPEGYFWESSSSPDGPWDVIPGAQESVYQPPPLLSTTWYRRGVAHPGCPSLESYTDAVRKTVVSTDGGIIGPEEQLVPVGGPGAPLVSLDTGGVELDAFAVSFQWTWWAEGHGEWMPLPSEDPYVLGEEFLIEITGNWEEVGTVFVRREKYANTCRMSEPAISNVVAITVSDAF